jgi:GNAT superfamily N-acetyltransferase
LGRVFAATDGERIAGYCTLAKTDCVPAAAYTPYIGYVFVGEAYRGARLSEKLVRAAAEHAYALGFSRVYLVSGEIGL